MRNRLFSFHAAARCDSPGQASDALCVVLTPIDKCSGYEANTENPKTRELVVMGGKYQNHERKEENFVAFVFD